MLTWRRRGIGTIINHNCDDINLQFELVGELFADMASEGEGKGRVQALQSGPRGGSKQMRRTVGSQVCSSLKDRFIMSGGA